MLPCPACGSVQTEILFSVVADEAAQHFVLREANQERHTALAAHIAVLWGQPRCDVRRCRDCNFGFADPFVAGDAIFYNLAYERIGYPSDKWEFDRTIRDLGTTGFIGRRILEAGAGSGLFLDKIADRYVPRSGITALEFSDASVATLRSKGYAARQEDIRDTALMPGFDAIFLFQVVEHMDRLDELFGRIRMLLSATGRAYIAVPNHRLIDFNERNDSLLDTPPNHISRWSPEAFGRFAERHGLKIEAVETEPFSLAEFIKGDIGYAYLRRSQVRGSIANRSRARRTKPAGKLIGAGIALLLAPSRVPVWLKAMHSPDLGSSLWTKLVPTSA